MAEQRDEKWRLCGVLDLWDSHQGPLVFDLYIPIAYMMLYHNDQLPPFSIGGHILAGYLSTAPPLSDAEWSVAVVSIAARLAQSLVYGYAAYHRNPTPDNLYTLNTQRTGWDVLKQVAKADNATIRSQWEAIAQTYAQK